MPLRKSLLRMFNRQQNTVARRLRQDRALTSDDPAARAGMILLTAIAAIVIVTLALVGLTQRSLRIHLESIKAVDALQQKWAARSIRKALLPSARGLLLPDGMRDAFHPLSDTIQLGNCRCEFLLDVETRKININTVYRQDRTALDSIIQQVNPAAARFLQLRPAPLSQGTNDSDVVAVPFETWGQVFRLNELTATQANLQQLAALTQNVTCWGSGRLCLRTTNEDHLRIVCELVVSPPEATAILRKWSTSNVQILLQQTVKREDERQQLALLLTEQPDAFSLWITTQSPHNAHTEFTVMQADEEGTVRTSTLTL